MISTVDLNLLCISAAVWAAEVSTGPGWRRDRGRRRRALVGAGGNLAAAGGLPGARFTFWPSLVLHAAGQGNPCQRACMPLPCTSCKHRCMAAACAALPPVVHGMPLHRSLLAIADGSGAVPIQATPFTGQDQNLGEIVRSKVDQLAAEQQLKTQLRHVAAPASLLAVPPL